MKTIKLEAQALSYEMNEELKQLRANIQFCGADKKIIMMTSAMAHEGKSVLSLELAESFAELGKRVLLLDIDMRKSVLTDKILDKDKTVTGLSEYLSGQAELEDLVYHWEEENIYCVFSGRVPPNPAELLANNRMRYLLNDARKDFDYVIVDCPPAGLVVDASVVASMCDGCIVIIKADTVSRSLAEDTIKKIERTGCPILGVVLNQVDTRRKGKYGKYKKYGYYGYYGYGKPKEEEEKA